MLKTIEPFFPSRIWSDSYYKRTKRKIISVEKKQGRSQGGNYTSVEQVWANMEKAALEEEY